MYLVRNSVDLITAIGFSEMAYQVSMRRFQALQVKEEETQERRPVATIDVQTILSRKSYLPEYKKSNQLSRNFIQATFVAPSAENNSNNTKKSDLNM